MLLDPMAAFLPMLQFVDAEENANDRVFGNVSRFSRARSGACIGARMAPFVWLYRLTVSSIGKYHPIQ